MFLFFSSFWTYGAWLVTAHPLPAGHAGAGSICRVTFCPIGAVTGGVASWAPGSLRAGDRTVNPSPACRHTKPLAMFNWLHGWEKVSSTVFLQSCIHQLVNRPNIKNFLCIDSEARFTFFAETNPINWRAIDKVFTGALQRTVFAIGATFTWTLTMNPLQ